MDVAVDMLDAALIFFMDAIVILLRSRTAILRV